MNLLRRILSAGAVCRLVVSLLAFPVGVCAQTPLWQGNGRIVISSDGNEHEHDDWAATPLSLAILAARGLQDTRSRIRILA